MTVTYYIGISNITDIPIKKTLLEERIPTNLGIYETFIGPVQDDLPNYQLAFTFDTSLSTTEKIILETIVNIIVNQTPITITTLTPTIYYTTKVPNQYCDNLNGYITGDIAVNINTNTIYTCYDDTLGTAIWNNISGVTGATGSTGSTGSQGSTGPRGDRNMSIFYNSGGSLANNRYIRYESQNNTEFQSQILMGVTGTLRNLNIQLQSAPGVGATRTFTIRKNGINTTLNVSITGAATTGSDNIDTVSVIPFDLISLLHTTTGSPASAGAIGTVLLT